MLRFIREWKHSTLRNDNPSLLVTFFWIRQTPVETPASATKRRSLKNKYDMEFFAEQDSFVTAFRGRSSLTWHVVIDKIKMLKKITYRKETK